ncbi:MAG: hypothetical protein V7636_1228 [Actinomycetota bacterium]
MASFPNLWPHRSSDSSEGFRTFRVRLAGAALVHAASAIASALSELATQGTDALRSTLMHSTGTRFLHSAALPVDASVLVHGGGSHV